MPKMKAIAAGGALLGAAAAIAAGTAFAVVALADDGGATPAVETRAAASGRDAAADGGAALSVQEVYRRTREGVVEVSATGGQGTRTPYGPAPQGEQRSQGSGFVIDRDGHIVTNYHVVAGATSVTVTFSDGREVDARVVGTDPSTDLALLDVDVPADELTPLELGRSSDVQVGDPVVAIGSPFGLEETVTTGVVSALDRSIDAPNGFAIDGAIQTDAAVNHGNSGGPLLDMSGRVIGVTSQIESRSGGNDGVGYAVPSDTVRDVVSQLLEDGEVEHAYLGVAIESAERGVRLAEVRPDSPASEAGLRSGDVVTAVDGKRVSSAEDLRGTIAAKRPGDEIELEVRRGDSARTVTVELGTRPAQALGWVERPRLP